MRYRVTFMERTDQGSPSEKPTEYLEIDSSDGVILDKHFLEPDQPVALRNQER